MKFLKLYEDVKQSKRIGIEHLNKIKPLEFIRLVKYFQKELKGEISQINSEISLKVDGIGFRFGVDEKNKLFFESSYSGPQFNDGAFAQYALDRYGSVNEMGLNLDNLFKQFKANSKIMNVLQKYPGIKIFGELLYTSMGKEVSKDLLKFLVISYDKSKLGSLATIVLFKIEDLEGLPHPSSDKIIKDLMATASDKSIKFEDIHDRVPSVNISLEINDFLKAIKKIKDIEYILKSRKKIDKPAKLATLTLIKEFQDKISHKMLDKFKQNKFGNEFEGLVYKMSNGATFKIVSELYQKNKDAFNKEYRASLEKLKSQKNESINEGGDISVDNVQATKIDLSKINRSKFIKDMKTSLMDLNIKYLKRYNKPLWPDVSKINYAGSSEHFMDNKLSDEVFKEKKPLVGDIDIQVNRETQKNLGVLLKPGLKLGKLKYEGRGKQEISQFNSIFSNKDKLNFQVDFEFVDEMENPEFVKFAHSSSWEDINVGIKGVFHKMLLGSIDSAKTFELIVLTRKTLKPKVVKTHSNAFSVDKGFRAKYEPALDPNGNRIFINGQPAFFEIKSKDAVYITNLKNIFETLFKKTPTKKELQQLSSFVGLTQLMKKYFDTKELKNIMDNYLNKILGSRAQLIEKGDKNLDQNIKVNSLETIIKIIPSLKSYQKIIDKTVKEYYI